MNMRKIALSGMALAVALALPAAAQRGGGPGGPGGPGGLHGGPGSPGGLIAGLGGRGLERLATLLGLSEAQQSGIKTIFEGARAQSEPILTQVRANRDQIEAAVKANKSDRDIEQLTAQQGTLTAQMTAIHAKAARQAWQLLTPEQRSKLDEMKTRAEERMKNRGNRGNAASN